MPKVFKNGNSLVVSVPKSYAHQLSIREGSSIDWKSTDEGLLLVSQKKSAKSVDQKFAKLVEEFIDDHEDVLRELANK